MTPLSFGSGRRFIKGLATDQRIVYACTVQARHYWFAQDARSDHVVGRVFGADGPAAVAACVGGGRGEDASDVGAQDGDNGQAEYETRRWGLRRWGGDAAEKGEDAPGEGWGVEGTTDIAGCGQWGAVMHLQSLYITIDYCAWVMGVGRMELVTYTSTFWNTSCLW